MTDDAWRPLPDHAPPARDRPGRRRAGPRGGRRALLARRRTAALATASSSSRLGSKVTCECVPARRRRPGRARRCWSPPASTASSTTSTTPGARPAGDRHQRRRRRGLQARHAAPRRRPPGRGARGAGHRSCRTGPGSASRASRCFADHLVLAERTEARTQLRLVDPATGEGDPLPMDEEVYDASGPDQPGVRHPDAAAASTASLTTPMQVDRRPPRRHRAEPTPSRSSSSSPSAAATTATATSAGASGRPPPTARRSRSAWSAASTRRSTARRRACCTATAPTRSRSTRRSRRSGCRCSTAASCSPSATSAAAARWAAAGTRTASSCAKPNTFSDFVACADHLVEQAITARDRLAIRGGSAGRAAHRRGAQPASRRAPPSPSPRSRSSTWSTTMSDPTIPLTVIEYDEWGNPDDPAFDEVMRSYSPYDNVRAAPTTRRCSSRRGSTTRACSTGSRRSGSPGCARPRPAADRSCCKTATRAPATPAGRAATTPGATRPDARVRHRPVQPDAPPMTDTDVMRVVAGAARGRRLVAPKGDRRAADDRPGQGGAVLLAAAGAAGGAACSTCSPAPAVSGSRRSRAARPRSPSSSGPSRPSTRCGRNIDAVGLPGATVVVGDVAKALRRRPRRAPRSTSCSPTRPTGCRPPSSRRVLEAAARPPRRRGRGRASSGPPGTARPPWPDALLRGQIPAATVTPPCTARDLAGSRSRERWQ